MYFSTLWFDIFVQTLSLCNMNRMFYWHTEALWCFFEEFMISLSCDLNFGWFVEAEFWRGSPPLYWWSRHNKPLSALAISKGLSGAFWIVCNLREEGGRDWIMIVNRPSKMPYLAIWFNRLVYVWANMGKVDGYWAEFWVFYGVDGIVQTPRGRLSHWNIFCSGTLGHSEEMGLFITDMCCNLATSKLQKLQWNFFRKVSTWKNWVTQLKL